MRHEADYDRPQPGRDAVIYTTPIPPWQPAPVVHLTGSQPTASSHRRIDIRPAPEIIQEQIDELRRRVAAARGIGEVRS